MSEIDPKAVEMADDWIYHHVPLHDIMSHWTGSMAEMLVAYAQERVEAERARIDSRLKDKSDYFQSLIDKGATDEQESNYQSKVSAIAYIRHEIVRAKPP